MPRSEPLIVDIARASTEDGPGVRSVVFFKGCPLRCAWCHNPEAQRAEPEELFDPDMCTGCGACRTGERCFALARRAVGRRYGVEELAALLLDDEPYYRHTGGGVTFSGGEPTLFHEYLVAVARALREREVSLAVETCGHFEHGPFFEELLPLLDIVYFDLKLIDAEEHRKHTGLSNDLILANLGRLAVFTDKLRVRIPLVPGFTATGENLRAAAALLARLKISEVELLPYNPSGLEKWRMLGREAPAGLPREPLSHEQQTRWREVLVGSRVVDV